MKRFTGLFFIIAVLMLAISCNTELDPTADLQLKNQTEVSSRVSGLPGMVMVKFASGFNGEYSIEKSAAGTTRMVSELADFNRRAQRIGVTKMERVFPPAGKFEERSRSAGLHLWYAVEFDESVALPQAMIELASGSEVVVVEPAEEVVLYNYNDPQLGLQWHYYNDGLIVPGAVAGVDARVVQAWEIETGKPEVIVCVVDGGIDVTHEDLIPNLWINEAELNGTPGIDDDGNGYVDDIHGHNFISGYTTLHPHTHGTHVAGTIAACNHNHTGVAGVAGGDGTSGSGVRLMSAQIFATERRGKRAATTRGVAEAIKYGADNGAVISQNSWGIDNATQTPQLVKEAIQYFIDHAGQDENGVQVGPMKGGLVVFAAGNDYSSVLSYPGSDDNVVSVAALGPDGKKAPYSNWGNWINISAPGGNDDLGTQGSVLSTIGGWNNGQFLTNGYGYMDGTSMACPHVSGVAALLVSQLGVGKLGLTPEKVKEILYSTAYSLDDYNPNYIGMLGSGAVDALAALQYSMMPENRPPIVNGNIPNAVITGLNRTHSINLTDYFSDPDGDPLTFSVVCSKEGIVDVSFSNGALFYTTTAFGNTRLTITASDPLGEKVSTYFRVTCQWNNSIFPPPETNRPGEMLPVAP